MPSSRPGYSVGARQPLPQLPPWFQRPDQTNWSPGYAQFYDQHGGDLGFLQRTAARGRAPMHPTPGVPVNDTDPEHPMASYGSEFQTALARLMMQHGGLAPYLSGMFGRGGRPG